MNQKELTRLVAELKKTATRETKLLMVAALLTGVLIGAIIGDVLC